MSDQISGRDTDNNQPTMSFPLLLGLKKNQY